MASTTQNKSNEKSPTADPTAPINQPGPKGAIVETEDTISLNLIEELWRVFCESDPKGKHFKTFSGSCDLKLVKTSVYQKFLVLFYMFAEMKEGTMLFFVGNVDSIGVAFTKKGDVLKSADTAKKPDLPIQELKKKLGKECYYWIRKEVMF